MISYIYVLMSLRSSTKSINPRVHKPPCVLLSLCKAANRIAGYPNALLYSRGRSCRRYNTSLVNSPSALLPYYTRTCTSPLLRLRDLLVRIWARRPLLLPLGFAAPFPAVIVLAVLVGVIMAVLWLVHSPGASAGPRSAVVRLAIRVVRARAVRRLVT